MIFLQLNPDIKNKFYILAIICVYALLNLPFLTVFPPIDNLGDESWMMSISSELLKTGKPIAAIHAGTPIGETPQVTTMWIYSSLLAGMVYIFGPFVWVGRFLSFMFGLLAVILTYHLGYKIVNHKIGLTAAFLLITSTAFSWHSREIRPDMMILAFSTASVYCFYRAFNEKKDKFLFLSGLISTMSVQVHPNGAIFAFSIVIIYIITYRKILFSKSSLSLIVGLCIGFASWTIFNYLPYSASSFQTIHKKYLPPLLTTNIFAILFHSLDFLWIFSPKNLNVLITQYYSTISAGIVYVALVIVTVSLIFGKNKKHSLLLLSFVILPLFISNFIVGAWQWFHYSVFLPLSFIILAISINDVCEMLSSIKAKRLFFAGLVIIIAISGIIDIMKLNVNMKKYNYNSLKERISQGVTNGTTVLGSPLYYFAFSGSNNRFITYLFIEGRCPNFKSEIQRHKIDYILVDDSLERVSSNWCSYLYYQNEIIPFLKTNTTLNKIIDIEYPSSLTAKRMIDKVYLFKVNRTFLQ